MSSHENITVYPEQAQKNAEFIKERKESGKQLRVQRTTKQARITHGTVAISCILLAISGLFVFVPPLTKAVGPDVVFVMRMVHRVVGLIFCLVPIISLIMAPKGALHILKKNTVKWDHDDVMWMKLFLPYLFTCKWLHMPDASETKSGQRVSDGMIILVAILMGVTGLVLTANVVGIISLGTTAHTVWLFLHDLGFFAICVLGMAHILLGGGIIGPYRGMHRVMFGDGSLSEGEAMYHWAHWVRKLHKEGSDELYWADAKTTKRIEE